LLALTPPVILIAGGRDKEGDFTQWVRLFKGRLRHLLLLGEAAAKIRDVCEKNSFYDYTMVSDMGKAVTMCKKIANPGESVLLSPGCASLDMFDSYEHRGDVFKKCIRDSM
jgi:UDP-N-acetylmuramoylalanine--D-glutamate ligase